MTETIIRYDVQTAPKLAMDLHILTIPVNRVAQNWTMVSPFLLDGLDRGQVTRRDYTLDQVKAALCSGLWQLVVAADDDGVVHGACAIEFIYRANDCVAFVVTMGGRGIVAADNGELFYELLRNCGATTIEVACRDSAARLFSMAGLQKKYTVLEKAL